MATATANMPNMAREKKNQPKDETGKPKRRPSVTLYARVEPELGRIFNEHVDTLRPKTSTQAMIEHLIEQYLRDQGLWPATRKPSGS